MLFVGTSYEAFSMSGIYRKIIYPRILLLYLAQSRLFRLVNDKFLIDKIRSIIVIVVIVSNRY
jgi:hypothetical protein